MSSASAGLEPVQKRTFLELALFFHGLESILLRHCICLCTSVLSQQC